MPSQSLENIFVYPYFEKKKRKDYMLLYPISWKGTLFLDIMDHDLKKSLMTLPEGVSSSEEGDARDHGWILKAHWQRLTTVLARVKTRNFFLYQNSKKTDVWSNITVLSSSSKVPRVFPSNYVILGKDSILHFEIPKTFACSEGLNREILSYKGVDATEETQS